MPAWRVPEDGGRDQERFARAADSGMRDTAREALERDLAINGMLREVGQYLDPDPEARQRMRSRVLHAFDGALEEPLTTTPVHSRGSGHRRSPAPDSRSRLAVAAAAALCLLMSLSGMGLLLSREALPGDALYGVKRSAESAALGLTFGERARALKHLEFADARIDEIELLVAEADARGSWGGEADPYLVALDDFDNAVTTATRLLTTVASENRGDQLTVLEGWAQRQAHRLEAVRAALPAESRARLAGSLALLEQVVNRANQLEQRTHCLTITSGARDELGPLPSDAECFPGPVEGAGSATQLAPQPPAAPRPPRALPPLVPMLPDGQQPVPAVPPGVEDRREVGLPLPGQDPSDPADTPQAPPTVVMPLPGLPGLPGL